MSLHQIRQGSVLVLLAGLTLLGSGCGTARPEAGTPSAATSQTPSTSTSTATSTVSSTGPSRPGTTPTPPATQQDFLAEARRTYPGKSDAALEAVAAAMCARIRTEHSTHNTVGELAGQLGSQAQAVRLVDAAVGAYCPTAALG